jgi:hypothetical protein
VVADGDAHKPPLTMTTAGCQAFDAVVCRVLAEEYPGTSWHPVRSCLNCEGLEPFTYVGPRGETACRRRGTPHSAPEASAIDI